MSDAVAKPAFLYKQETLPALIMICPSLSSTFDATSQDVDDRHLDITCLLLPRLERAQKNARCRVRTCDFLRVKQALYR